MSFALCLACLAQLDTPEEALERGVSVEIPVVVITERALEADESLLNEHRGYLRFLEDRPDLATAEEPYQELLSLPAFGAAAGVFEEALAAEPAAREQFDAFHSTLARNEEVRRAVDSLDRLELETLHARHEVSRALRYLRAHPDEALARLDLTGAAKPMPEALYPVWLRIERDETVRETLRREFGALHAQAAAHADIFPWWAAVASDETALGRAEGRLREYLLARPGQFWVWRRRHTALAAEPRARDWIRHWHAQVRRDPALADLYFIYLKRLRREPALARAAEARWRQEFGPAPEWPPEGNPPEPRGRAEARIEKRLAPRPSELIPDAPRLPAKPEKTEAPMPAAPARPTKPATPIKPEPSKPGQPRAVAPRRIPFDEPWEWKLPPLQEERKP